MANILSSKSAFLSYLTGWIAIFGLMAVVVFSPGNTSKKAFNHPSSPASWVANLR